MTGYTREELENALARNKQRKQVLSQGNPTSPVTTRDYREGAELFSTYAPKKMDTNLVENPFSDQISQQIGRVSAQDTARSGVEAQNRFNFEQLQIEQARLAQAKKDQVKATKEQLQGPKPLSVPHVNTPGKPGLPQSNNHITADEYYGTQGTNPAAGAGTSYYTQTPDWLNINAGLTTFEAGGKSYTVNASVAGRFKGFINALLATGYKIKVAGSYADRNQANGSGNPSLHSMGLAIDINPYAAGNSYNPGNAGKHYENLPPNISALAAKYGLVWGGDWRNSKDYMHFSVPYNGLL